MNWENFFQGVLFGSLLGVVFLSGMVFMFSDVNKYKDYTEHACVNLRMTHACKILTDDYVNGRYKGDN